MTLKNIQLFELVSKLCKNSIWGGWRQLMLKKQANLKDVKEHREDIFLVFFAELDSTLEVR